MEPDKFIMDRFIRYFFKNIILIGIIICFSRAAYSETLYVFYPTPMRSHIMQKQMEEALAGLNITVFSRYKDFKAKVEADSPDAVLTKEPVIMQIQGYHIKLKGSRKGNVNEPYVLLSVDKKLDVNKLANIPVGVFDILGRKGMKSFIKDYLKSGPRLKRVSKLEDLLPLLLLNMADAILIPEVYVNYFKDISRLNFVVNPVSRMNIGIIAMAVKDGVKPKSIIQIFKGMDNKTKALMEVDNWSAH